MIQNCVPTCYELHPDEGKEKNDNGDQHHKLVHHCVLEREGSEGEVFPIEATSGHSVLTVVDLK